MSFEKPNLTNIWNEAVNKQDRGDINLFEMNDIWGALRLLQKYELCKISEL